MFCIKLKNVSVNKEIYCDWIAEKRELIFASSWQNETIYSTFIRFGSKRLGEDEGWKRLALSSAARQPV